ncbi:MAG TPA: glycoside hydrolase family 32 protein [Ktedonobacteraceae bacterium]|nr:glycoside hydrolase family 32 protein [Ktedonobacteraceae bacterium]
MSSSAANQRKKLEGDPHRPHFHFLPPANWMNDPNGLIQWKGQYHLFYQYNPYGAFHAQIHWGHAVSPDLVHWTDLPIALTPTPGRADANGCWTGCAIDNDGIPTLLYSGVYPQIVCLATSDDDLLTWQYYLDNPVIDGPPAELRASTGGHFRDPFVWKENNYWYMLIGSGIVGVGGTILLYRSLDLTHWQYLHPLLVGDASALQPLWTGVIWECPNLLTFGDLRVLLFSVQGPQDELFYPLYVTGTFQDEHFHPQTQGMLVHGGYFYAPQVFRDDQGRYIMWGWLMEGRSKSLSQKAGWSGVMSLPIIVSPLPGSRLSLEPAPELTTLREKHWHYEELELSEGRYFSHDDIRGDRLEMLVECEPGRNSEFGLKFRCSPDGQEQTRLVYQSESQQVSIEREQSSLNAEVDRENCSMAVEADTGEVLKLHIFLDGSVVEVFANGCSYLASRIYPERHDSLGIELFARRGRVTVRSLDIWHLASIWNI